MNFEKSNYLACLLDFYGNLLTQKQLIVAKLILFDNYGLTEIANLHNTTKQAINDLWNRTSGLLVEYENKLHLNEKYEKSLLLLSKNKDLKDNFIKIWE